MLITFFPACNLLRKNERTLEQNINKISQNGNISYDYIFKTKNFFNSTSCLDTGRVSRFTVGDGINGYGFYARENKTGIYF